PHKDLPVLTICVNEAEDSSFYLGSLGSLPEARSVIGEALMTMLPSLMLRHMIFAKGLGAILTLFVLWCYTSAFITLFQAFKPTSNGDPLRVVCGWFKLELGLGQILVSDSTSTLDLARVSHDYW